MRACMYSCMYATVHSFMYICMYLCMYVCMYVCMYIVPYKHCWFSSIWLQFHHHQYQKATFVNTATHFDGAECLHKDQRPYYKLQSRTTLALHLSNILVSSLTEAKTDCQDWYNCLQGLQVNLSACKQVYFSDP